jgi:hypothetical protein
MSAAKNLVRLLVLAIIEHLNGVTREARGRRRE